jgi:hypothetical protein
MERDLLLLALLLGVGVPVAASLLPAEQGETANQLARIGLLSAAVSVPVGLVSLRLVGITGTAVLLTGLGYWIKHHELAKAADK